AYRSHRSCTPESTVPGAGAIVRGRWRVPSHGEPAMIRSTEYVLSESPFVVRRTVRWSDCDPAGVVYTGRFTDYVLGAVGLFHQHMSGYANRPLGELHGVGTPCKGMEFEFIGTMWPGDI